MPAPVVAGVDGSPESLAALDWAVDEAVRRGAPLRLVHAWPSPVTPLGVLGTADLQRRQADQVLSEAETRVRERRPELAVATSLVPDDAVRMLVEEAGSAGPEGLLVLGSRGLGTLAGFLVGSVGHRVLGRAECPVVLVRRAGDAPAAPAEVVAGVDVYDGADEVLGFAFPTAERLGLPLRVVYAWTLPPSYQYAGIAASVDVTSETAAYATGELNRVVEPWRARYPKVTVAEEAVNDRAAHALAEHASAAELVVVGRRVRRSMIGALVGPVAHGVLHHAACPVAVVPYEREDDDA